MSDERKSGWKKDPNALLNALIVVLAGGAIYVSLWIIVGFLGRDTAFASPESEVWRSIICCQGVLWSAALWHSREDLSWAFARGRAAWSYGVAVFAALALSTLGPRVFETLVAVFPRFEELSFGLRVFAVVFTTIGALVGAVLATTIGVALVELRTKVPTFTFLSETRTRLRRTATTLSVILVVAVTSTSWLSRAMEQMGEGYFPPQIVFSYGLYFTAVLLVVYLPASTEFYRAAVWLADETYDLAQFDKDKSEARGALLNELGITAGDAFQGALATLSPIVSAVLAVALGAD
jgi:hypothetical protein